MIRPASDATIPRTALVVAPLPALGRDAAAVLARIGFVSVARAASLEVAEARLARDHVDLLVVPLDAAPERLESLTRAAHAAGSLVVGAADRLEAETVLRAMRAGVHECLSVPIDPSELEAAFDRLERRTSGVAAAGVAVAVYSAKGGLGTTTVAVNLAQAFARNNPRARIALADLVVSGGDVAVHLDITPSYDIGTLANKIATLDSELLRSVLSQRDAHTWVLAASERPEVTEMVDAAAAAAIVGQCRRDFDFAVIDCEHHVSDRSLAALDAADRIVLVTQLGLAPLRSAQRSLALFERLGYTSDRVVVVVNRHQSGDVLSLADAKRALGQDVLMMLPNDFRLCADALARGHSVIEHAPEAPLARAYLELAARIGGAPPEAPPAARLGRLLAMVRR